MELEAIARSRTDWACRVQRARILLAYHANPSTYAVGEAVGVTHQTVQRCLDRAARRGVMAALDDSPRPGREPTITDEARAWVVSLACQKPKDMGYPHELWTTRLLARHIRESAEAAGHHCLMRLAQGTVCKILDRHAVQPHKVRYYLERRDEAFEQCQCRLKSPQKCRLKIPHFVARCAALKRGCHGARSRQGTRAVARAASGFIP